MKIKSLIEFSAVPKGTEGEAVRDGALWKITWDDVEVMRGIPFKKRKLEDWFDDLEFKKYLEVVS